MSAQWPSAVSTASNLYTAVNILTTTLSVPLTASTPSVITVASTTGFPTAGAITIDNEVIFYTGISGNTFTGLTRGADGTTAASHSVGVSVGATLVANHINALNSEVIAVENDLHARFGFGSSAIAVPSGVDFSIASSTGLSISSDISFPSTVGVVRAVNVKDFGAKGDGSTNDTAAFNSAVATGRSVFVPATSSYYKLTSTVNLTNANQRIFGEGWKSKIVQTGTNTESTVFLINGVSGVTVENLYLVPCSTTNNVSYGYGVGLNNADHCVVTRCLVTGHRRGGVGIINSSYNIVSDNIFKDSAVNPATDTNVGTDVYVVYGGSYNTIIGNICASGVGTGIAVQTLDSATSIGNTISGNVVQNQGVYGIMLYRGGGPAGVIEQTVIANNTITHVTGQIVDPTDGACFGAGIYLQGPEYTSVVGNTVEDTSASTLVDLLAPGCIGTANCTNFIISGNIVRNSNGWYGITVRDPNTSGASTGYAVVSNNIAYTHKIGIQVLERGRVNINGNTVDTTTNGGIAVVNTADNYQIDVIGNTLRNIGTTGIDFAHVIGAKITENDIQLFGASGNYGIHTGHTTDLTIMNNTLSNPSSGAYGISISSSDTNGLVTGNYVTGCGSGIGLSNSSSSVISISNKVFNNSTNYSGGTFVTDTELSYVAGVTSSIQTQFGTKAPLASPTFTGAVTVPDGSAGASGVRVTSQDSGLYYGGSSQLGVNVNGTHSSSFFATTTSDGTAKTLQKWFCGGNTGASYLIAQTTTSITNSLTTILPANEFCNLALVSGNDGSNYFAELVLAIFGSSTVVVVGTKTSGSPAARTYDVNAGNIRVSLASGTYAVSAVALELRNR